jgi:hypothetical protein
MACDVQNGERPMESTFIRIIDKTKDEEILININFISEIHVEYIVKGEFAKMPVGFSVALSEGRTNPETLRVYHFVVGGTKRTLIANPGSKVMKIFEDIYKNAIKD